MNHTTLTPDQYRRKIAHLARCRVDISMRLYIAQLGNDAKEARRLSAELCHLNRRLEGLKRELPGLAELWAEQARAVAQVCEWLGVEVRG